MKHLIIIALAISCFWLLPIRTNSAGPPAARKSGDHLCPADSFVVDDTGAPARLTITDAQCNGPKWSATLTLTNTNDKVIIGYEISNVETYDHKKNVKSTQGESGFKLKPGDSKEISSNGGFRNGLSYGKPTGSIRKNVFRVTRIRFVDGSVWRLKTTS